MCMTVSLRTWLSGKRVAGDRSSSCAIACNDVHAVAVGSQRANTYGASVRRMPRGCCSLQPFRNECDSGDRRIAKRICGRMRRRVGLRTGDVVGELVVDGGVGATAPTRREHAQG